ncbi:MFS transporter [Silanimonas sp.]|jgi:AAA family ATP:ADP antiporter|uniref:NTP/NDP exchange transporter n=1 Tax=Silanimonas sp. TaxID=1929290 RepID=UPI0022C0A0DE|nr:MFS transporter [Silanimonas sp.]MCZ8164756.1 MFS transporter [Silanimonas sp.]
MDLLQRLLNLRAGEWRPVLLSGMYFFAVLAALMLLRPARDALGMQRGMDEIRWLFFGTAAVTLLVQPLFGWLVAKWRRMRFIAACHGFFALSLLGFHLLLVAAPDAIGVRSGQAFYVWFSVFNFFVTMLFWALMADRFTLEQSQRLFPPIAAGGTLGAITGSWAAGAWVAAIGTPALLLVAAGLLVVAVVLAAQVIRTTEAVPVALSASRDEAPMGGSAWAGLRALLRSTYLSGIALYVLVLAVMVTFLYFTRLQLVAGLESGLDARTALFANVDFYTQLATLLLQLVLAGHLIKRIGMPLTLALLPAVAALGFIGLAIVGSLLALVLVEATFRAVQRAVMRPARETLFTVVDREEKYKAKAVIDTFVYRLGDIVGAQSEGLLGRLGWGLHALASVAVPLALFWAVLGVWLGLRQRALAKTDDGGVGSPPC